MKKLLEKLFCKHEWKELTRFKNGRFGIYINCEQDTYVQIVYSCIHCGKVKKIKGDELYG